MNIDDLVENIYEEAGKALCVQNEAVRKCFTENTTQLIKVHGCVRNPEVGFIFGKDEYQDSIDQENFKLRSFAQDFFDSDVIFVGTEFNEEDILYLINKYKKSGSRSNGRRYFFIAPSIKTKLKKMINNNEDFYYLPWTAKVFLEKCAHITNSMDMLLEKEKVLKDYYFQKVAERAVHKKYYTSELYYGRYSTWTDFAEAWDVLLPEGQKCVEWIQKDSNQKIVAVVGSSYVGKSVFARRILFDLYKAGYEAYEYNFKSAMELELLKDYVKVLPVGSNIALLVEDAAMQYKCLVDFMNNKPENIGRMVFILVSKPYYHEMKRHELIDMRVREIMIKPQMNYNIANNVLDKLKEKHRLGELNQYGDSDSEKIKFIKSKVSVIDVFYTLTHGRGFEEFFTNCYEKLEVETKDKNFFDEICVLYLMGFEDYPKKLQAMLDKNFNITKFLNVFEDIVIEDESGNLKIQCAEVFEMIVKSKLSSKDKQRILLKYFRMFEGLFTEGEENEWNTYFEKLLKLDALINNVKLDLDDIGEIFISIEKDYEKISYYWMQRGLYEQRKNQFENANTFLNNAQQIQKRSYQIRHALAKNEMAWGVYELKNQYFGSAAYHYEKGEEKFLELINSPDYSKALGYSVHSYVNLKIDYYTLASDVLSDEEIGDMYGYLIQTATADYKVMQQAVQKVYEYCMAKGIKKDVTEKFEKENFWQCKKAYEHREGINFVRDYMIM